MIRFLAAFALVAAACDQGGPATAQPAVAQPTLLALTGRVVDAANLLDDGAERSLTERLARLEQETTDQLVVVTVPNLGGQSVEEYSLGLGKRWGIGRADVDNGVIILVAPTERKVRIEVGLGLEGLLTDEKAGRVVQAMLPRFKTGEYGAGLTLAVEQIDQLLRSDRRRPQPRLAPLRKAA